MYDADTKSLPPPSGVPRERALSVGWAPDGGARPRFRISAQGGGAARGKTAKGAGRMGLLCAVMLVCLIGLLWPAVGRTVASVQGGVPSFSAVGQTLCRFLLELGLPPAYSSPESGGAGGGAPVDTETVAEGTAVVETTVADTSVGDGESAPSPTDGETDDRDTEETSAEFVTGSETEADAEASSETHPSTDGEETRPSEPDHWADLPVVSVDMSEAEQGGIYIQRDEGVAHLSPAETWAWPSGQTPLVLLVHAHPFEAYAPDGGEGYRGTVAELGARLSALLREQGVEVIHVHPAMTGITADTSYREAGERTRAAIEYYLSLYPEIGVVIDLRRSAELWQDGDGRQGILRTEGWLDGAPCAQVRVVVDGAHDPWETAAVRRDAAAAVALRSRLFRRGETLTRPTLIRDGRGMISPNADVVSLTLEVGAAGNTYAEAARILPLLAFEMADWLGVGQKI